MGLCKQCESEVDELKAVKINGKKMRICEDCAERLEAENAIAEESEAVVRNMMGYKGTR